MFYVKYKSVIKFRKEGLLMAELQNVGVVDSLQYQPSQYPKEDYIEDLNTQPQVFDEKAAEIQAANKSRLGATLFSAMVIGGLAYLGGRTMGKRAAKAELEKAKEAAAKYEESQKVIEEIKNDAENLNKRVKALSQNNVNKGGQKFLNYLRDITNKIIEKIDGLNKTAKDVAE